MVVRSKREVEHEASHKDAVDPKAWVCCGSSRGAGVLVGEEVDHQKSQSPQNFLQETLRNWQSAFNRDDDLGGFPTVTKDRRSRRTSLFDRGGGHQRRIIPLSMKIMSSFWFFGGQVCHFPLLILFAKHLNQDSSLSVDWHVVKKKRWFGSETTMRLRRRLRFTNNARNW